MYKTRVVHCRKEPYDVLIDRTTKYGNPFRIGKGMTREDSVKNHKLWVRHLIPGPNNETPPSIQEIKTELRGKTLA